MPRPSVSATPEMSPMRDRGRCRPTACRPGGGSRCQSAASSGPYAAMERIASSAHDMTSIDTPSDAARVVVARVDIGTLGRRGVGFGRPDTDDAHALHRPARRRAADPKSPSPTTATSKRGVIALSCGLRRRRACPRLSSSLCARVSSGACSCCVARSICKCGVSSSFSLPAPWAREASSRHEHAVLE